MSQTTTSSAGAISIGSPQAPRTERNPVGPPAPRRKSSQERTNQATEQALDEAIEDSFPASDPPSHSSPSRPGTASDHPGD